MIIFNPASVFYFATCLRLDDSEAELYHSILETLNREISTEEEILIAIKNITLCDTPIQIYSFPYVINQFSKLDKFHPTIKIALKEYCQIFIELFGEHKEIISYLFDELINISKGENIGSKLIQLADLAHSFHLDSGNSETFLPYIDIVEFASEAITLFLLIHFSESQEVSNFLRNHLEENPNSSINILIGNSYSHKRGRICFLSSVELKRQLQISDSKENFSKHIWRNNSVSTSPDLEPDLVFLFLEFWFVFFDETSTEEEKIDNLLIELSSFNLYAEHLISITDREDFAHKDFVRYLKILFGKEINPNSFLYEKSSLSINIWIGSIYLLISECFEVTLSESALSKMWEPINLYAPGIAFNSRFEMISEKATSLINAKSGGDPKRKKTQINNLKIFSPWLTLDTSEQSFRNYIEIESYSNWLRSLYAVKSSITILTKGKTDNASLFAYYLIHVSELLSFCKGLLNKKRVDENNKLGSRINKTLERKPQLFKLLLILNRDLNKLIGGNKISTLSSNYFYSVLENDKSKYAWEKNFKSDVVPKVLYNWIIYCSLQHSIFKTNSVNQNKIFKSLDSKKLKKEYKVRLKVLRKFLHNDEISEVAILSSNLDMILLLSPNSISEIKCPDSNVVIDSHISFAIAVQKFNFAIRVGLTPIDEYRNTLVEILKSIRVTNDFSYPNRFAIASLYNEFDKINEENAEVFKLSIEVLFELNGLFDISLLSSRLIEKVISLENYNFNQAQIGVLNCLSNSVSIALKYNIHERNNTDRPTDPLLNVLQNHQINFLRHTLNSIQYIILKFKTQLKNKVGVSNYYHSTQLNFSIETTDVSIKDNIPIFTLPGNFKPSPAQELSLITYNTFDQTAQFYLHNINLPPKTINLFILKDEEKQNIFSGFSNEVLILAKCVGLVEQNNQIKYKLLIEKNEIRFCTFQNIIIPIGQLVQVKYYYHTTYKKWIIDNKHCLFINQDSENSSVITINKIEDIKKFNLPLNYWLPSYSDIFTGHIHSELCTSGTSIMIGEERKPVFYFFNTLLSKLKDINSKIVLTFIEIEWDVDRQEYGYLFYQTFGLYFLLFEDEISFPESKDCNFAEFMQREIGDGDLEISSLNGLLVSFQLSFKDSNLKLAIVCPNAINADKSDKRFPLLQTPFDDRNIKWRTMFDESADVEFIARNERGGWVCVIDEMWERLGFSETIFVTLDKYPHHQDEIDFLIEKGWSNDGGRFRHIISGKIIERSSIKISQLQNYLGLEENQKVQIKTALQLSKKWATIPCFSKDNYRVSINLEELTFLPINREGQNFDKAFQNGSFYISNITKWRVSKTELVINDFPPKKLKDVSKIVGYFINIPRRKEQGIGSCTVMLEESEYNLGEEIEIKIENISEEEIQRGLTLYSRIEGKLINRKWHFYLLTRQIFLKSARKLKKILDDNFTDYYFLGKTTLNGEPKYLFEKENQLGVLFYSKEYHHTTRGNDLYNNRNQLNPNWLSYALGNNVSRIGFVYHERIIAGSINGVINLQSNQIASLQNISFRFEQVEGDEYFVRRNFTIGVREQAQKKDLRPDVLKHKEQENEKRLKLFNEYFEEPSPLNGSIEKEHLNVLITYSSKLNWIPINGEWTNKVSLINSSNETLDNLVFVPSAIPSYDLKDATFWLKKNGDDTISATMKLGYQTLDEFFEKHDSKLDEIIDVSSNKIYFADKEKVHPYTNTEHSQEMYRFEEGFGKNILIPKDQILYQGKLIQTAELILFNSDSIRKFKFVKINTNNNKLIHLNILEIERSQAYELYSQAFYHNIYHIANITFYGNKIFINSIRGVDIYSINPNRMTYDYKRISATFDKKSTERLIEKFKTESEKLDKVILVRVDTDYFNKTSGRIQLNHCKLTFIENKLNNFLKIINRRDRAIFPRVILELGTIDISWTGNDYLVKVTPPQGFEKEDIGEDFQKGVILRRDFSLNEGILREYYRREQINFFEGYEAYITVFPKANNKNQISFSLVGNSDFKPQSVLYSYNHIVAISKRSAVRSEALTVEIKPGNFIRIDNRSLSFADQITIKKGDVLNIEIYNKMFFISNAIAGDYRFLLNNRPVVVLPKDSAFKLENDVRKPYTVGGLPNIELDSNENDNEQRIKFLTLPHPKIASVNIVDELQTLRLNLHNESILSGSIQIDRHTNEAKFIANSSKGIYQLDLKEISYYDVSAPQLLSRISLCQWQYHDEETGRLIKSDTGYRKQSFKLLPSKLIRTSDRSYISGPIFCENVLGKVKFRHTNGLLFWSYPVSSLIDFLDSSNKAYTFAYAGKQDNIHFIEIAPGRIVELPINLLILKMNLIEIPMKNYAWDFLNIGDEIRLKNITDDLSDQFKIQLISIRHIFRNILKTVFNAPINKFSNNEGLLEIGCDEFAVKLPISKNEEQYKINKQVSFISNSNEILVDNNPHDNDIVLISISNKTLFSILGYPSIRVHCFEQNNEKTIIELIEKSGGAIPGLIFKEGDDWFFKIISLTTFEVLIDDQIISGEIIDSLNDEYNELIVKIGGYLEIVPYENIISGIPKNHRKYVTQSLIRRQVWLQVDFDKSRNTYSLISGLSKSRSGNEIFVNKISHITNGEGIFIGTICRANLSLQYFWMPEKEMAWCNIKIEIADCVFYNVNDNELKPTPVSIKVKICNGNTGDFISRVKTTELNNSFRKKRCGSDNIDVLTITSPAKSSDSKLSFIGYSLLHKVLVYCVLFDDPTTKIPRLNEVIKTEVIEKDVKGLKIKTLFGNKKILLHIPIYKKGVINLSESVKQLNESINHLLTYNNHELINHTSEVNKSYTSIISEKGNNNASLKSGFIVLERLCRLQNLDEQNNYTSRITKLLDLLKLNLLRYICIEILNKNEAHILHDRYLDLVLYDSLKPFYNKHDNYVTVEDFNRLRRIALIFCFQKNDKIIMEKDYPAIGNSILQLLGLNSHLDMQLIKASNFYKFFTLLDSFSYTETKTINNEFIELLKEIINVIEINNIEINIRQERLMK